MNLKRLSLVCSMFLLAIGTMLAQRTVTGTISDGTGEALIGASVSVKGTDVGTVTDVDGMYRINVPAGATTLVVTYTGYATQELALGAGNVQNVTMQEGVLLNEAVVTALGITREKKSLGYSVQEVDGESLETARDPNMINALSGKVAGLQITSSSGNVGSSSRVVLRGNNSISGNSEPLYVINGVPVINQTNNANSRYGGVDYGSPINDINPEDIESVSVLKGAAAAALYGSRASNGVILITTKNGSAGSKDFSVSYSGNVGFSNPLRLPDYQNDFGQGIGFQFNYVDGTNTAAGNLYDGVDESWGPSFDPSISAVDGIDNDGDGDVDESGEGVNINQFTGQDQPWVARPDNIKNFFETGIAVTNNVSISMNKDNLNGRLSYTNMDQKGMVPNTDLRRNSINAAVDMGITDKLKFGVDVIYTNTASDNRPGVGYDGDNVMQQTIWTGRQVDWEALRDNYETRDEFGQFYNWNHNYQTNPYYTLYNNVKPTNRDRLFGTVTADYELTDWLKVQGRVGQDFYTEERRRIFAKETLDFPNGQFSQDNFTVSERNYDLWLRADKQISDDFSIGGLVGVNRRDESYQTDGILLPELTVPGIYNASNVLGNPQVFQTDRERRVNSIYGQVNFAYQNFLYLDVTARQDWFSTLPEDNNSYLYPSVSVSAVLNDVLNLPTDISFLKLRAAYADVGADTDPYSLRQTFASNPAWGGIPSFAVPNVRPNANLRPQNTESLEFGLEFNLFNNRLGAEVTYYDSKTIDQIIRVAASPTTGYTNRFTNAGTLANNGIEVAINATPISTPDFSWDLNLNWAKNNSEVRDLPEGVDAIPLGDYWGLTLEAREGQPFGTFRGLKALENDNGDLILNGGVPSIDSDPNGDGSGNLTTLGDINPDWIGGVRNTFNYKGLSLSVLIDARQGSDLFSMTYMFGRYAGALEESLEGRNTLDEIQNGYVYDGVVDNGDGTFSPNETPVDAETWNVYYWRGLSGHSRSIFDASFVKLREVNLSYRLPKNLFENNFVEGITLGVYGRNLALLHSNVPHIDPETGFSSNLSVQGFEFGQLPSARTVGVQLRANF